MVKTQLAYIEQRKGNERALQLYEDVVHSKAELSVKAVCSNNIVTLREGDKFDSLRKLQKLRNEAVQSKLAPMQLQVIGFNHGLLLLSMNKVEECNQLLESLTQQYPKNDLYPILASSILHKEKKNVQSQEILKEFLTKKTQKAQSMRA